MDEKLDVATIRKCYDQLKSVEYYPGTFKTYLIDPEVVAAVSEHVQLSRAVHLSEDGIVLFPGGAMHPESFRFIVGDEAYQYLLKQPRVPSPIRWEQTDVKPESR